VADAPLAKRFGYAKIGPSSPSASTLGCFVPVLSRRSRSWWVRMNRDDLSTVAADKLVHGFALTMYDDLELNAV
jgi:hypothetical protein